MVRTTSSCNVCVQPGDNWKASSSLLGQHIETNNHLHSLYCLWALWSHQWTTLTCLDYGRRNPKWGRHANSSHNEKSQKLYTEATPLHWIRIHGNSQEQQRLTTMSLNFCYSPSSFTFLSLFLSLPLSQGSLQKKKRFEKDGVNRARTIQYLLLPYWQQRKN